MSQQENPYDFILNNPATAAKRRGPTTMKQRLIVVGGGGLLLVIILIIAVGVIIGSGNKDSKALYAVAAAQQDIIDLTTLGLSNLRDQNQINLTVNTNAVVTSHYNQTKDYISTKGLSKTSTKQITALRDEQYKKALDDAKNNGTYDDAYKGVLANRIDLYRTKLQTAYSAVSGQTIKNQLNSQYMQLNSLSPGQ